MKIKLINLTLVNFKGARNKTINFANETFIFGENAAGKTTIFDAFTWLLFGKDSDGRADFQIKTLDENGLAIPQIDHEVVGTIEVDGKQIVFKRVLREKWVKKRGFEETNFEGNETIYFVDDVPMKAGEYQSKISALIDENLFKLITSPTAFNSLKWQDRRTTLIEIAGGVDSNEIIKGLDASADQKQFIINLLASDKTIEDEKRRIAADIKRQKDELKTIPTRIDEAERLKPEGKDIVATIVVKRNKSKKLESIDAQIQDKGKALDSIVESANEKKKELYALRSAIDKQEQLLKAQAESETATDSKELDALCKEYEQLEQKIKDTAQETKANEEKIKTYRSLIASIDIEQDAKRKEWTNVNTETLEENAKACPTCSQQLPKEKQEVLELTFHGAKKQRLKKIEAEGQELEREKKQRFASVGTLIDTQKANEKLIAEINTTIENVNAKIEAIKMAQTKPTETKAQAFERLKSLDSTLIDLLSKHKICEKKISELEKQMQNPDTDALKEQRQSILKEISDLNEILSTEKTIKQFEARIHDLKGQEKTLAQAIATTERDLFLIDKFNKSNIEALESKINALFSFVNFKMFEQQINGGESETCICTVNGVPYSDLNTAMKINAGLDIINSLANHYNTFAPIFVDGRESIIDLINTNTQIINLVVSDGDKELRIL